MGKSKDKKAALEAKEAKKLALGVKRKQLKRKKDRRLDCAVDDETASDHGVAEDKKAERVKKIVLMKQKKKNKHAKVKSNETRADGVAGLLSDSKDDAASKIMKKRKKKLKPTADSSSVKPEENSFVSHDSGAPKKKNRKVKREKSSARLNDAEEIIHVNRDEETQSADDNQIVVQSEDIHNQDTEKAKSAKKNKIKKVKKSGKANKKDYSASREENNLERHEVGTANADEIPSIDEDCSRGMKKWILEYKQKRPGLKVLQARIDEFIIAYEEQQEKERKEKEAREKEEGWTVVEHHKGRKKTTDAETGTAVGSVSLAAMQEKMAKKKPKEIDPNFYRFQKREAQLSELAKLQSKFEQDKKRVQELRAQRKFKPY